MGAHCCSHDHEPPIKPDPKYRRILWIALIVNFAMFAIEIIFSLQSKSVSLLADSIGFLGDAANCGSAFGCWRRVCGRMQKHRHWYELTHRKRNHLALS